MTAHPHGDQVRRAGEAGHHAAPGLDPAGVIQVRLDDDGVAESIRVRAVELPRLSADELGAMVVAADTAAAANVAEAMGEALAVDPSIVEEMPGLRPPDGSGAARPLADLTERTLIAFDRLGSVAQPPPPAVGGDGPVRLTLILGRITSCSIEPRWLAHAHPSSLAEELDRALVAVRRTQREARQPIDDLNRDLARLLLDVKATLRTYVEGV